MSFRDVVRRGSKALGISAVPHHDHDGSDVSGDVSFLYGVFSNVHIRGDLSIQGFLRTAESGQRIELRPDSGPTGLVPSFVFWTGNDFAHHEAFIEIRDHGAGVWGLVLAGPTDTPGAAADIQLNSDGGISISAPAGISLPSTLFLRPQEDAGDEGAEIDLLGSGSFADWVIDLFQNDFRIRNEAGGGAVVYRIGGAEVARIFADDHGWEDYTPTMTFATVVNGTVTGRVRQLGKVVDFYGSYTVGSSDTVSAGFSTAPPVEPAAYYLTSFVPVGQATYFDASPGTAWAGPLLNHGTTGRFRFWVINPATASGINVVSGTAPFTFATGDVVRWEGRYEAAA